MTIHPPGLGGVLRGIGSAAAVGLAVVGLVAAPGAVLGGIVVGVFVGGGAAVRMQDRPDVDRGATRRSAVTAGVTALWLWLVGSGLLVLLGWSVASVLVALLLVGVPAVLHLRRRAVAPEPSVPAPQPPAVVPAPVVGTLSRAQLCHDWRQSYLALIDLPAGPARGKLVAARQVILDELERRDEVGFQCWLEAGPRAGSDPGRYLTPGRGA